MQYCRTRFDCTNFSTARRASWCSARVTNESHLTSVPPDGDCEHLVQPILGSKPDAIALPNPVKLGNSLVLLTFDVDFIYAAAFLGKSGSQVLFLHLFELYLIHFSALLSPLVLTMIFLLLVLVSIPQAFMLSVSFW